MIIISQQFWGVGTYWLEGTVMADSKGLGMFCVLIWVLDTWVYSICETSLRCTPVKHTFLYVYYPLMKYTQEQQNTEIQSKLRKVKQR